jgi:hypothetical protein
MRVDQEFHLLSQRDVDGIKMMSGDLRGPLNFSETTEPRSG